MVHAREAENAAEVEQLGDHLLDGDEQHRDPAHHLPIDRVEWMYMYNTS